MFRLGIFLSAFVFSASGQVNIPDDVFHHSLEYELTQKEILKAFSLQDTLVIEYPLFSDHRATGSSSDPDYAIYDSHSASLELSEYNLQSYNRIHFSIRPDCDGVIVVNSNLVINNQAAHLLNLKNHQWNDCILEFDETMKEPVRHLSFYTDNKGPCINPDDSCRYIIKDITFERVAQPEKMTGWIPQNRNEIVYSSGGYAAKGKKTAFMHVDNTKARNFALIDNNGKKVFIGKTHIAKLSQHDELFALMDFSEFTESGIYIIRCGDSETKPFAIGNGVLTNVTEKLLNFIFCQRCGYAVPGVHDKCHEDLFAHHGDSIISYGGGWHDAGDLSQQTLQSADITFALLESSAKIRQQNPELADRLMQEAQWGLKFILNNRFGDSYRASSMGLLIWQDGKVGTRDDIHTVRVQNMAYDNFLYAAYEAFAARQEGIEEPLRTELKKAAEEDFRFASEKFAREGYDTFVQPYEHTYSTSHSQYHATISWAASQLYALTGKTEYAIRAASEMEYVMQCQQKETTDGLQETAGFFWRDTDKKSIVHYIHQSREQLYIQALTALCQTQPENPHRDEWESAMRLHADYLKSIMKYTAPYGMIPSGVYHEDEYKDAESFRMLHLFPPEDAEEHYTEQLKNGIQLTEKLYMKRFPVWFNIFNGNNAVMLAMGKSAALLGQYFHDDELMDIAREQVYWLMGKNPFRQSMIYGIGERYPQMDSFSSGEMIGEVPVGIRTLDDTDEPYWPQTNNACYKEVWTPVAGKALSVLSEINY